MPAALFRTLLAVIVIVNTYALANGQAAEGDAKTPMTLRLLSYNIHHGQGTDDNIDLQRIANVIIASNADLVALQEVDETTTRSRGVDQAAKLAELTGMNVVFGPAMNFQGGRYGVAILSRRPINQSTAIALPDPNHLEPRVVLAALVQLDGGQAILFASTHLEHHNDSQRLTQAKAINQDVPAWAAGLGHAPAPMVLAGDMNVGSGSDVLNELTTVWTDPDTGMNSPTFPELNTEIDHVLLRPADRFNVISYQVLTSVELESGVLDTGVASDHYPVLLTVQLVPEPAAAALRSPMGTAQLTRGQGR